ncbi:MAG: phosphopyruvate hydratase [Parcubacteria group bacterium]
MRIKSVRAIEILDSRGNPTVKARVILENGMEGVAAIPSGISTGTHEAVELRDNNKRFGGKGVLDAVNDVNGEIAQTIVGMEVGDQLLIDEILVRLDGTENKSRLGANAILAVSCAAARAAAISDGIPLYRYLNRITGGGMKMPIPLMNIMNGGAHANWVTDIQEYMVIPVGFTSFRESLRACAEIYAALRKILKSNNLSTNVGDEGGFAPRELDNREPLKLMAEAVTQTGLVLGRDINFGIDAAATEFYRGGKYIFGREKIELSAGELARFYERIVEEDGVVSIEDPFAEDEWENFAAITTNLGNKVQIVGDDLYATNAYRIEKGANISATNAVLIKPNQIGTLSETFQAIALTKKSGQSVVISHRSGDTEDSFIADLAVAVGADEIKSGAPARGERTAKYNRLLEIEEELT